MTIAPCNRLPTRFAALTCILAGAIGLVPAAADAAPKQAATPQLIERDARAGKIERDTATLYVAYALGRPGKLPATYRSDTPWDGTLPLLRVREAVKRMKPGRRREAAQEALAVTAPSTPSCSASAGALPNQAQTTNFYVQYGTVGGGLTLADYLTSLEGAWGKEVTSFGWARPPVSTTPAPGSKYHVRIDALSPGLYGYVSSGGTHAGLVGDNPATAWNEGDAYATCMVLNRDYSSFPSTPQASLDSTTAHEFNHSIQFGYGALSGANVPDDDFVEGGATWMEDEVYDSANDNYNYLWPDFADSMGDYDGSPYPYWITFRGLTEHYGTGVAGGGEQVMQDFWEATSKNTGNNLTAMQAALAVRGTTLADAFHAYAVAVKLNKPCGAGYAYPYCFEEGPAYVATAGATAVHETIAAVGDSTPNARVEDNYALNWVSLPATGGPYDVTLSNTSAGGQLRGSVVCDTGSALSLWPLPAIAGPGATSTLPGFTPASCSGAPVLVVTNQSQTSPNPTTSTLRTYRVSTASSTTPPTSHTLTVSKGGTGSGTVTSNPGGIDCGADCSQSYAVGTTVTLTATAAPGAAFSGWSGDCAGSGTTCTVEMTGARNATATFTANPSGTGTVSSPVGAVVGPVVSPVVAPVRLAALDRTAPVQGPLRLSVSSFRAARSGPSARAAAAVGTKVSYALSEQATSRFQVERAVRGRRVGGRCVRATRANAGLRACTRYVLLRGSFRRNGRAGASSFRFTGRLSGRALKRGRYRLVARSTDAAGNRSAPRRARFRIVR
ncbi:MAG: InlB B-repeat-containing protein [Thermoleophilaceae bacterium]